ncbi:MAG: PIG-L deacetylase family protein [Ilumatobacteraceae bacterium]
MNASGSGEVLRDRLRDARGGGRWMVVVAHPDDEAFGCGSLIAHAASGGADVTVLCATRGEAGEPSPAMGPAIDLGATRAGELLDAVRVLGGRNVELLDGPRLRR